MIQVQDLMVKDTAVCYPQSTLNEAARIMWEHDCGFVPVVESKSSAKVVGVITDRDACMAAYTRGVGLKELRVADVMSKQVRACRPTDSLAEAESCLGEARVRRLPVTDANGKLLGVLSLADIAREASRERTRGTPAVMESEVGALLATVCQARELPAIAV